MSSQIDRRAPGSTRIPLDAMVEVGGAQGPSFEAQATNVSSAGISLRTGYLPEIGQPLTCQFDTEDGLCILASGEVVWRSERPEGGEFGLKFTNVDGQSLTALQSLLARPGREQAAPQGAPKVPSGRVRLHIEGLGSPMKARVRDASLAKVTAYSELGFLQIGKEIELEDAETGDKRPAHVDRVDIETSEARVPQLIVTMKYDDAAGAAAAVAPRPRQEAGEDEEDEGGRAVGGKGSALAASVVGGVKKIGPAMAQLWARTKTTASLLAGKKPAKAAEGEETPARRMTAPPPGGALHAAGRKVVRDEPEALEADEVAEPRKVDKRKLAIGGAVGVALILGLFAMRKPTPAPLVSAPIAETAVAAAPPPAAPAASTLPAQVNPGMAGAQATSAGGPGAGSPASPMGVAGGTGAGASPTPFVDDSEATPPGQGGKKGKPKPFSNGTVAHGNVLKLKMDGPIEKLQGAGQPTGFTVVIPHRRSLEAASPLAQRDSRIASIRVANDPNGAEVTVAFKDGVPNYVVRAKGDTLEMVLAPQHQAKGGAKPEKKPGKHAKSGSKGHGKH